MLVSEIATRVKRQFGDESGVQITDDDVIRWTNDAMREIASSNDLLQTRATTALVVGQAEYTLPPDILLLRSVHMAGKKLTPLSTREAEEYTIDTGAKGSPSTFWIWANKIKLYPAPDVADPDDLQIYYTRTPALVTVVGNTPELPVEYHSRIVEYCLAQAYELDENWEAAQQKGNQFTVGLQTLKGKEEWQTVDYYPSITSLPEDYGYDATGMYW